MVPIVAGNARFVPQMGIVVPVRAAGRSQNPIGRPA